LEDAAAMSRSSVLVRLGPLLSVLVLLCLVCPVSAQYLKKINRNNFNQIEQGMTLQQVQKIIGAPGAEQANDGFSVTWIWGSRTKNIRVRFISNRAVGKYETGI
jgi:outer membrane protein assembly factor BamE (lipoprotein component of BamABCDE complex)